MNVSIVGAGMIPVREHWSKGIRELAAAAARLALEDAGIAHVDALYVGNAYGATFNQQTQLGGLIGAELGMNGIEAFTCEAGDASGGVALRTACFAVESGLVRSALVVGVEKATDIVGPARVGARTISLDADLESVNGVTMTALAALVMRRYMYQNDLTLSDFEGFSINAHRNGAVNPCAMYRNRLRDGAFAKAPMIADPVSLFDCAPDGDGAAAVVVVESELAADMVPRPVQICASAVATDRFMLQDRDDPLQFGAIEKSFFGALEQAQLGREDIDLFELHDAYTIMTTLALEAMGYCPSGAGWTLASEKGANISLDGDLPISTFGGLKSRGNPGGATGIYQAVESTLQLRESAGSNQVPDARRALIQNIAGPGSTVVTHILQRQPDEA
ncbi:MAG: thiolase domain-containing protein [Chloroflexi bacterium]|nr:thiolase domain-containing protein [Chloroflexota bacterium]